MSFSSVIITGSTGELTDKEAEQCRAIYESVGKFATVSKFKSLEDWEKHFMQQTLMELEVWQKIADAAALYSKSRGKNKLNNKQMTTLVDQLMNVSSGFVRSGKIHDCYKQVGGQVVVPIVVNDGHKGFIVGAEGEKFIDEQLAN